MIRGFSLAFSFGTGSLWPLILAATALPPQAIGYPLGLFLSWRLNLLVAEWWIAALDPASTGTCRQGSIITRCTAQPQVRRSTADALSQRLPGHLRGRAAQLTVRTGRRPAGAWQLDGTRAGLVRCLGGALRCP
jgi:hypothetical protein